MGYIFPDEGLRALPTGSIGLVFTADNGSALPADIAVVATGIASEVTTEFNGLELVTEPDSAWQFAEITGPLPLGDSYLVEVLFDGVKVHEQELDMPAPGARRGRVLRQRIYELLFAGYRNGAIEVLPFGDGHVPGSINQGFKAEGGTIVEVGAAHVTGVELWTIGTRKSAVQLPLNLYCGMDDAEDTEDLAADLEEVCDYLLATDWKLNSFGLTQSEGKFTAGQPQINEDRKLTVVKGALTVSMRRQLS